MNGVICTSRRAVSSIKKGFLIKQVFSDSGARHLSTTPSSNMKFVQFTYKNKPEEIRVGYLESDNVIDVNKADSSLPTTLLEILRNGHIDKVRKLKGSPVPLENVTLKAPIHGMDKVLCVGLNYKDHCDEQNLKPPEVPMIFSKFSSTVIGPNDPLRLRTDITKKVDWEVEMVVVIGKKACFVKEKDAHDYIFGYTIAQDVSARDWQKQKNSGQFLLGKSMDTFCPIGPCIVTADEIGNPESLDIRCTLNGVEKQKSNTNQLIYKIPFLIERLSSVMTLLPGDIILTGTPGGVGMYRDPPEYLKPGDILCNEIQKIGVLNVRVEKF